MNDPGGYGGNMQMQPYQGGGYANNGYNDFNNYNNSYNTYNNAPNPNDYGNNGRFNGGGFMPVNSNQYGQNGGAQSPDMITSSNIRWTSGIDEMKRTQLASNCNCVMFDGNTNGLMYIKSCDNIGKPNMQYFKYTEITEQEALSLINANYPQYVTKEELKEMLAELTNKGGDDNGKQSVQSAKSSK